MPKEDDRLILSWTRTELANPISKPFLTLYLLSILSLCFPFLSIPFLPIYFLFFFHFLSFQFLPWPFFFFQHFHFPFLSFISACFFSFVCSLYCPFLIYCKTQDRTWWEWTCIAADKRLQRLLKHKISLQCWELTRAKNEIPTLTVSSETGV